MRACAEKERDARSSGPARFKKGTWTLEEDELLRAFVRQHGPHRWNTAHSLFPDLHRSGKSCRLRYINQLHPNIRRGSISSSEEALIFVYHFMYGNQWSRIASKLPGRTDNAVKNVVNMRLKRARRQAASINFAQKVAACTPSQNQLYYTCPISTMATPVEAYPHSMQPAVVPPSRMATVMAMQEAWRCPTSSPPTGSLVSSTDMPPPMVNDTKAGIVACINDPGAIAGPHMSFPYSESLMSLPPQSFPQLTPVQEQSSQQLPSVQIQSFQQLPFVHTQSFQKLPSVQMESFLQLSSVQQPLQSLEGSEIPLNQETLQMFSIASEMYSAQKSFESLSIGSELPAVLMQQQQAKMADLPEKQYAGGDNDLLEAMKLTGGYSCSSASSWSSSSSSPSSSTEISGFYLDDSYVNTLLMGMQEAGCGFMATALPASSPNESCLCSSPSKITSCATMAVSSSPLQVLKHEAGSSFWNEGSSWCDLQQALAREEFSRLTLSSDNRTAAGGGMVHNEAGDGDAAGVVLLSSEWSCMPAVCHHHAGENSADSSLVMDFS